MTLNDFIAANGTKWVNQRRAFHRNAELGFTEYATAAHIASELETLGYSVSTGAEVMESDSMRGRPTADAIARRMATVTEPNQAQWVKAMGAHGQTGVVAELKRGDGPVIALRFDIDALPIQEAELPAHRPSAEGFASMNACVMHACGHDGHAAIGLGVAQWCAHPASDWRGTLRLIFQPAEEGGRGAKAMADAGIADDVDYFFAAHLGCGLGSRQIATAAVGMLYSTKLDVRFRGTSAHAAGNPHEGRNALLAGANATMNLHAISRHPSGNSRINVGKMVAGQGRNIIAEECLLEMEVRGDNETVANFMEEQARTILSAAAAMHGVEVDITVVGQTIGGECDPQARAAISAAAHATDGVDSVLDEWHMT
nr:amidohydrolase [Gammaproteobacteria bacterium]